MKKTIARVVAAAAICLAALGVGSIEAGRKSVPAPPPPVLCGCACPDGSFVITHAPDAESCPAVCEQACNNTM
jgi:hypothetical protein